MKIILGMILFFFFTSALCIGQGEGVNALSPVDNTKKWKYPYEVDANRANELYDGIGKLADLAGSKNSALDSSDAINLFGPPDMITNLEGPFTSLSAKEETYIAQNKPELKWRLLWFLKKNSKVTNADDKWIGVYIKKNSDQIMNFIFN
jgi:hypothetical protein